MDQPLPASLKLLTRHVPVSVIPLLVRSRKLLRGFIRQYSSHMVVDRNALTERKARYFRGLREGPDMPERMRFLTLLGRDVLRDDLDTRLEQIRVPVLVVWSDRDPTCPLASARLIAERAPGAELVLLGGCAHNPHLERFEDFNRALEAFAARRGRSGGSP